MKKIFLIHITILQLLMFSVVSEAYVTGDCSSCHTMHNSQNGASMRLDITPITGQGTGECLDCHSDNRGILLRRDCVGCHARNSGGAANIVDNTPQVAHNAASDLAAGNFRYVFGGNDAKGHNIHGFGASINPDLFLLNSPPGYDINYDPSTGGYQNNLEMQIMCAGQNGCHGNRDILAPMSAIRGGHHGIDNVLKFGSIAEGSQGADVPTSYRFLYKVHGGEVTGWVNVDQNTHNEYKGDIFAVRAAQAWANVDTISEFCAECHGDFHASAEITNVAGSPWIRHPTDVDIPNSGEYASMTTTYSVETPVARVNIPNAVSNSVDPSNATDVVMCLSCHAAHGTNYDDILRFDYTTLADGTGCIRCHTSKEPY